MGQLVAVGRVSGRVSLCVRTCMHCIGHAYVNGQTDKHVNLLFDIGVHMLSIGWGFTFHRPQGSISQATPAFQGTSSMNLPCQ